MVVAPALKHLANPKQTGGLESPPWAENWALEVLLWVAQLWDEARSGAGWGWWARQHISRRESIIRWGRPPKRGETCSSRAELACSPSASPGPGMSFGD